MTVLDLPALRGAGRCPAQGLQLRLVQAAADPGHGQDPVQPVDLPDQRHLRARRGDGAARRRLGLLLPPRAAAHRAAGTASRRLRMQGGWNRMRAGMPLIMMKAQGPGFVAFSADHPGEILAVPLEREPGRRRRGAPVPRRDRATSATSGTTPTSGSPPRAATKSGMALPDRHGSSTASSPQGSPGLLLLHAPGNSFVRDLGHGERILVQPRRADLEGPVSPDVPALRVPAGNYWFSSARWQAKSIWLTLRDLAGSRSSRCSSSRRLSGPSSGTPGRRRSSGSRRSGGTQRCRRMPPRAAA